MTDIENNDLPPAAQRALAEAEERRKNAKALELAPELGGRNGPEQFSLITDLCVIRRKSWCCG